MPATMDTTTSFLFYVGFLAATAGDMIPCGDITINGDTSICCEERVYIKYGIEPACCGMRAYDAFTHICCIEYVWPKMGENPTCCGNQLYDTKIHECSHDGQLTMKADPNLGNSKGESPMLMKPTDVTLPPDDNYYIDKDYEIDHNEYPDSYVTHGSGTENGENEIHYKPILYKTRPSKPITISPEYLTDLPEDFWKHFEGDVDNNEETDNSIADKSLSATTPDRDPKDTTLSTLSTSSIMIPVGRNLNVPKLTVESTTNAPAIKENTKTEEQSFSFTTNDVVPFSDETSKSPIYPPLLPSKVLPEQNHELCCQNSGLTLYECCLHALNNSLNTLLPPCCSGFVVKVCCWTGENDYSCCSRQEACCHPEKLYQNTRNNKPNDWLAYNTNFIRKTTNVPVIKPQKTEVNGISNISGKCCRSGSRPKCCLTFHTRINCCVQHEQTAPPRVIPPWQPRLTTSKHTTTQTTARTTTTLPISRNAWCCTVSSTRPTCCSTVIIRPYCCFRQQSRNTSLLRQNHPSKTLLRNCRCQKRRCCGTRWPKRCCTINPAPNSLQQPQRTQEEQNDGTGASCCASRAKSTCCWILHVQSSRIPRCCENHLSFASNNQPQPLCSKKPYNPVKEMCCQGQKQVKRGVRPRCCGRKAYDAYLFYCCQGRISETC